MTRAKSVANLIRQKTMLAEKYEGLAGAARSAPRRARLLRLSRRYRRQAAQLAGREHATS